MASELCSISAVASCDAFLGRGVMLEYLFSGNPDHLADGCRPAEDFFDRRLAQRPHAGFASGIEQLRAVGLLGNQASDGVVDGKDLENAVPAGVTRLPAVEAAAAGSDCAGVAAAAVAQAARTKVFFYVPSLEQLRRGGRIGAAASLLGTMLAIKPILAVDGGRIVPLEKVRSGARAVARLEEIVVAQAAARPAGSVRLAVHHFGNPEEAESLAARLEAALPDCPPAQISSLPAVLAAHAGLGVLAVIVGRTADGPGAGAHLST